MYMMAQAFEQQVQKMRKMFTNHDERLETLKNLDLFVLDNSLRETTVGQLRGHTLENKKRIYEQVKKVGYTDIIIESFNHLNRVGESFIKNLVENGEDVSERYAFSELFDRIGDDKVPITREIPIGLLKMKQYGIKHAIIEIDLMYYDIDYTKFTMEFLCHLLWDRIQWLRTHLDQKSKIFF